MCSLGTPPPDIWVGCGVVKEGHASPYTELCSAGLHCDACELKPQYSERITVWETSGHAELMIPYTDEGLCICLRVCAV